ncbi:hypothetical protein TCAL_02667, partial [Tigriopus californicus]
MDGPAGRALPHADPAVVEKLVEELKSQGVFDQFRKECLAEVDTKNLRSRVEGSVNRFLSKQSSGWKPSQNKNHLRNLLRKHIQESSYLESGMDRIVDQVVNPKILSVIEPQVEGVICNFLGVAKPPEEDETEPSPAAEPVANGHISDVEMGEKLSNISSEDIEMRSAEDPTSTRDDPGAPPTASPTGTPQIPGGDISPLTPPLPPSPGSPHTPPLPPPTSAPSAPTEVVMEEVIALEDQHAMSPVSDTDFDNVSPPKDSPITPSESSLPSPPGEESQPLSLPLPPQAPPPPPPPAQQPPPPPETPPLPPGPVGRPPSPLTSPIGSSSDDMDHNEDTGTSPAPPNPPRGASSLSGPSDISDTDLPASNSNSEGEKDMSEADLNALEKARAELQAKLAAASIEEDDSEGEIRTDDDSEATNKSYVEKFNEIMSSDASVPPTPDQSGSKIPTPPPGDAVSPISDSMSPLAMSKTSEEVKSSSSESDDDKKPEGVGMSKKKDGHNSDDDRSGNSGGASANPDPKSQPHPPPEEKDSQGPPDQASKSPKCDDKKNRRSSSTSSSHDRKPHRSSKKEDEKKKSGHSHSHPHKSSKHRPDDKHRRKSTEERRSKDVKDTKDTKETKDAKEKKKLDKERIEKEKIKLQAIEKKIKEKDKFSDFDMFAPKPPKPKAVLSRPPSSASSKGSASPLAFGAKSPLAFGSKTPPAFGSKTPPAFGSKTPPSFGSKTPPVFGHKSQPKANGSHVANGLKPPPPLIKTSSAGTGSPGPDNDKMKKVKAEKEKIDKDSPKVERKVFPELPLPKTNGDKLKQHEVDILEAKQRLEEARQKRLVEIKKLELEKKQKKRSMSSSTGDSSPSSSATHSKPPKSESKKTKVKDKPTVVPKERKKLTLSDLSDEEEVSDWSDAEAPSSVRNASKRKRKPVLADSSEDDEDRDDESGSKSDKGPKRQTRTLALKAKADSILNSDPATKVFQGFKEDGAEEGDRKTDALEEHSRVLAEYLDDEDNISLDEVPLDELDLPNELLTLEDLHDPEATCNLLKGFGGHPTLTQGPPQWLKAVLSSWNLTRSEVNLFYQRPTKILSQVKPISEYAYNRSRPKLGRKSSPPLETWSTKPVVSTPEPVLFDEPDFFGFESTAEAEKKFLFRLNPDSPIDENGNTFGMKSEDFLDLEQIENDDDDDDGKNIVLPQLNVNIEDQLLRELEVLADEEPESAPDPQTSTDAPPVVNGGSEDLD